MKFSSVRFGLFFTVFQKRNLFGLFWFGSVQLIGLFENTKQEMNDLSSGEERCVRRDLWLVFFFSRNEIECE